MGMSRRTKFITEYRQAGMGMVMWTIQWGMGKDGNEMVRGWVQHILPCHPLTQAQVMPSACMCRLMQMRRHAGNMLVYHGLYGSRSCCINHGPSQWKRAIFDSDSSETPGPIFMKLEIYNYFLDKTPNTKFQEAMSTWVVWANSQLTHESFCPFFCFFTEATGHIFGHTPTPNTSFWSRQCLLGVRRMKFETHELAYTLKAGSWQI